MKLQHIAAAVALATVGAAAQATMATGGNGSMVLIAFDNIGGTTTAGIFDLGLTLDQFAGSTSNGSGYSAGSLASTLGSSVVWDFNANTINVNGVTTSFGGTNDWTAAWNRLLANSDASELRFVVTALDTTGFGNASRTLATGNALQTASVLAAQNNSLQTNSQFIGAGKTNDIFTPTQNKGTHGTAANGAYTFTAADGATTRANGYVKAGDAFANNWRNNVVLAGAEAFASSHAAYLESQDTRLWLLDGTGAEVASVGNINLNVATGQLVYTAAAIPEPSTYALAVTGLILAGAVARRRRAA